VESKLNTTQHTETFLNAALEAFTFGFIPIPLIPESKRTSEKWDPWQIKLDDYKINWYWKRHPNYEVGIIVGDNIIVYDADTPESLAQLYEIEKILDIHSNHTVLTKKGEHHYFCIPDDVIAKQNSHGTEKFPNRIDVKTGRTMVVRPPSTGKEMGIDEAESVNDLTPVTQEFVDAINLHNGIGKIERSNRVITKSKESFTSEETKVINDLIQFISPTCSRDAWIRVGMAIHHEMAGSIEGLAIWDEWSSTGDGYNGYDEVKYQYSSFNNPQQGPKYNLITLANLAEENGANSMAIQMQFEEDFELIDEETPAEKTKVETQPKAINPLAKYSLFGKSTEYGLQVAEEQFVLGSIALKGQMTTIYAEQNTGKTLIVTALLIEAIGAALIDGKDTYYINADDNFRGLHTKMTFADEYGFNMLAPGNEGFKVENLTEALIEMTANGTAKNTIVVVDTLKKFTDLMNKRKSSQFAQIARQFVSQGGTIILLAHVNKKRGEDGKAIYAGTSDIMDDCDCAYILDTVCVKDGIKIVQFENTKSRGSVASKAAYQYAVEDDISYNELIATVTYVEDIDVERIAQVDECNAEAPCVEAIIKSLEQGINTKMKLASSVAKDINQSKRKVIKIIEKYSGDDPAIHKWTFKVKARGAKAFELIRQPEKQP